MGKNRLKNYLKLGVLLFGVSLIFVNCQKEETLEHSAEVLENNSLEFSRVSINDLIKNDDIFSKLSENYLADKVSRQGFLAKSSVDDLIITSDTINVIEKENYKSYTIRIQRKDQEYDTENLIIENIDGVENAYVLSYNFDSEWVANSIKGIYTQPKGKVYYSEFDSSKTSLARSSTTCNYITITITVPCPCVGHYGSCSCYQQAYSYSVTQQFCTSGDDNDNGGPLPDGNNEGGFGSGGGGPSPSNPNNNSQTQSNLEDMAEFVEFKVNRLITRLELNTEQAEWVAENIEKSLDIYDYVAKENSWANDAKEFAKAAVEVLMANPEANPLLGADCSSFEFAQPPGALQKGCAVSDFNHTFYVAGVRPNGSPYYGDVSVNLSTAYFTMPTSMTNGQAANLTAVAVTNAIRLTDVFYFENPDATSSQVQNSFNTNLTQQLGINGGTISGVEPFQIPNPAPYLTSFFGAKTDCN